MRTLATTVFASSLLALASPGCARFDIHDAASRIAFARGCGAHDISLVEHYRAAYEASGCGEVGLYRCAGHQCSPLEDTQAEESMAVAQAQWRLNAIQEQVLDCSYGQPITVQFVVTGEQHEISDFHLYPDQIGPVVRCVREQIRHTIWLSEWFTETRPVLLSHHFSR